MTKAQKDFIPNEKYGSVRFMRGTQIDQVPPPATQSFFTHPGGVAAPIWKTVAQVWTILASAVFDSTAPTTSAVGDVAAAGSAATAAHRDHLHGREAFGSPSASAVGDTSANGSATTLVRSDHRHAREAFGAVTAQTTVGAASTNGAATTDARSDHAHGTPTAASIATAVFPAWSAWTPTIAPGSGAWTTATGSGRFLQVGKTLFIQFHLSISVFNTGAGFATFTLPNSLTANGNQNAFVGREAAITGFGTMGPVSNGSNLVSLVLTNNGATANNNYLFDGNGVIEVN